MMTLSICLIFFLKTNSLYLTYSQNVYNIGLLLRFIIHTGISYLFSPFLDMSFQCLGSWPGENHGETYMSLLDTKLPQLGEEARPRYRCAVSPPNFTFPFFSKPACSAELNEHLVCCFQKRQSNGVAKRILANQLTKRVPFTPALKARLLRLKIKNFAALFASHLLSEINYLSQRTIKKFLRILIFLWAKSWGCPKS